MEYHTPDKSKLLDFNFPGTRKHTSIFDDIDKRHVNIVKKIDALNIDNESKYESLKNAIDRVNTRLNERILGFDN